MNDQGMFPGCVLPGCNDPVAEVGEVCAACRNAFGPLLRPTGGPAMTAAEINARDSEVAAQYHAQAMTAGRHA